MKIKDYKLEGIYLVIDPQMKKAELLYKLKAALGGGVALVQIWNNWPPEFDTAEKIRFINEIITITENYAVPVLINDTWQLVQKTALDGVHFDEIPADFEHIKAAIKKPVIYGLTCSNDLSRIRWAEKYDFDYVSFCAVFPSSSVNSCEIVKPETIIKARKMTQMPLFLSGGIHLSNVETLKDYNIEGVAVISGILDSNSPQETAKAYLKKLQNKTL